MVNMMKDIESIHKEFMSDIRNAIDYGAVTILIFGLLSLCVYRFSPMFAFASIIFGLIAFMIIQTYFLVVRTDNFVKSIS